MSTRRLRARLDRLTQSAKNTNVENKDRACDFTIDPALAKTIRDDRKRLDELKFERLGNWRNYVETEEARTLRARIAKMASTISCPASYGFNEVWDDRARLMALQGDDDLMPGITYPRRNDLKDPDAVEAQFIARIEAFNQTPEGRERARLSELIGPRWKSPTEHRELDRLLTLYPEPDCHPKDPMKDAIVHWRRALLGDRKRAAQRDQLLFEKANRLRRRVD